MFRKRLLSLVLNCFCRSKVFLFVYKRRCLFLINDPNAFIVDKIYTNIISCLFLFHFFPLKHIPPYSTPYTWQQKMLSGIDSLVVQHMQHSTHTPPLFMNKVSSSCWVIPMCKGNIKGTKMSCLPICTGFFTQGSVSYCQTYANIHEYINGDKCC